MTTHQIAQVAHDANASYCRSIGDNSQKSWNEAAEWQRDSAIKGVAFRISAKLKGETPSASAQHNAWLADKLADGWKYGPMKDASKKEHPCFVPYEQLSLEQRMKDYLFAAIVDCLTQ